MDLQIIGSKLPSNRQALREFLNMRKENLIHMKVQNFVFKKLLYFGNKYAFKLNKNTIVLYISWNHYTKNADALWKRLVLQISNLIINRTSVN